MAEERKTAVPAAAQEQQPQTELASKEDTARREPLGEQPPNSFGARAGKEISKKKKKKRALLFLGVLFGLMVVLILLNTVDFAALSEKFKDNSSDNSPQQVAQIYPKEWFEPEDYGEDITADPDYMELNRDLTYKYGNETFVIARDPASHGAICAFWYDYMNALIEGDARKLNSMHADDFVERMRKQGEFTEGYEKGFTPQKIFNFTASLRDMQNLQDTGDANGNYKGYTVYYFVVSYQIKDNNGSFRRDFYDDGQTVPLVYEVLENGNEIRINGYSRIRTVTGENNEEKGINFMMYLWIALILLAVVAELLTTTLVAVWFIPSGIVSLVLSIIWPDQIVAQIVTYVAVSALLLILTRPLVKRHFQKGAYQPTNADMVVGKIATVTEAIDNVAQTGEVSVAGKRWSARSADGGPIAVDTLVSVLEIQGVKLICTPAPEGAKAE